MKKQKLFNKIYVYSNLFNDVETTLQHFLKDREWVPWSDTGNMANVHHSDYYFSNKSFPTKSEWDKWVKSISQKPMGQGSELPGIEKELYEIFYKVSLDYINTLGVSLPEWYLDSVTVCRYETNSGHSEEWAMTYHNDCQRNDPDLYYFITMNMYLNDDYEGGEVHFKIPNMELKKYDKISIKPKAGDIVVFPCRYDHAVKPTLSGSKSFVRMHWKARASEIGRLSLKEIYEII